MLDSTLSIEEARRHLHEIIRRDAPFDERARESLELATQCLGVDNGHITRIDEETNYWEAVITTDTADGQTPPELELDLGKTYCRKTIDDETPLPVHDVGNQGWDEDPAFDSRELHTYLGIPLIVDNEAYGTVCFVAEDPQSDPFDDAEIRFAEHLSRLLERELEREHVEAKLTNQTNLSSVLNRVLRHNLRNDISVVRGYTELISDQLEDDTAVSKVLDHIDDIIKLSDKARELEEIIATSTERQHIEIGQFIEDIVGQIEQHHPAASISVEYDDEIHVNVLQNFDRAIEELIKNAVTHSGQNPTVTVAIDQAPNAVEIRLSDDGPGLPEAEAKVLEAGAETPLTHGSGLGLWMAHWIVTSHDGSLDPVATEDGTTLAITLPRKPAVGVQKQLTELERSRDKYKATFEEATDAIAIVNDDGRIIEANPATGTVFGVDSPELLGRSLTEFLPDEFKFDSEWETVQQVGDERDAITVTRADGAERVLEYSAIADIIPGQHLFISRDVTDRKEREAELQETKQRLDLALEGTDTGVWEWDIQTDEVFWSESMERLFGLDPGTFEGTYAAFRERVHPDDREKLEDTIEACLENDKPLQLEYRIHRTDGTERWVEGRGEIHEDDGTRQMVGVLTDITERKERERRIEQEQARFKAVFDDAFDPMVIADDDGRYIEVNESATELFGIPEEELLGETIAEFAPEDFDFEAAWIEFQNSEADRGTFPLVRADGSERIVEYAASRDIVPGEHLSVLRDITERKERERELERAETVFQNTQDALFVIDVTEDKEFYIQRVNAVYEELTGLSNEEIQGKNPREVVGDDIGSEIEAQYRDCVERRETIEYAEEIPVDGDLHHWQTKLTPVVEDGRVETLVGAMRDVTAQKA